MKGHESGGSACILAAGSSGSNSHGMREKRGGDTYSLRRFRKDPKHFDLIPEKDKQLTARLREIVLSGELAMLYTLGFQFYIHHPYYTVLEVVNKLATKDCTTESSKFWNSIKNKHLQV